MAQLYRIYLQCKRHRRQIGKIPWRRKWQPTLVFLSGKSHGQKSLVGCSPRCCEELDRTEHERRQKTDRDTPRYGTAKTALPVQGARV